ncbi:long-chain-acyl-CoA synthetase [Stenotrophobium rhamnosiphilum]|uniref:Long-chain-acyl-CoA synthetase n=1 Tax=Stenotrophobium rhamnosiphilum TaxID=2029166 RepID=A0A2T5MEK1_9GAMM|nr:long-chain-acyl-CoA synthetase [Stenotrophobium rhamnosiphilum]PTU30969.1 long-chain-acyl-CoA synthetase [Stenotrophobium rhamnosiphilum]
MSSDNHTVGLRDIARGVFRSLPEMFTVQKGVLNLLLAKPDRHASIGLLVEQHAARTPSHPALLFEDQSWTYAEFNAWSNRIASVLRAHGVKSGDAVAVLMENRPEALACITAIVKLGAVAGMINTNQRADVLTHSLNLTKARVVIVGDECLESLESTDCHPDKDKSRIYLWEGPGRALGGYRNLRAESKTASGANPPETQTIQLRQPCFYIFTSGTTGLPKASVMTHYRWLRGMAGLGQMVLRMRSEDVLYCCLPLYHNNALTVSWSSVLGAGATLALGRKFSATKFWSEIRRYDATAFCYIGELCRYLLNRPKTSRDLDHRVRVIVGNGLRPEIWDEFQTRFGIERISEFYGASESNLAFANGFDLSKTAGFCPLPFAIVEFDAEQEVPVRDGRGFMSKVAKGGVGLLITEVTDRTPFDGYTDKKASDAKLLRNVFKKNDCWFNSGDLVRDQGWRHIQFVDRVGDTFRWKGENVATTEVEGALNRFEGIEQAVVYGVQVPGTDGRAGMAALSVVGQKLDGLKLAQHLCAELPAYAVPLFLRLREVQEVTGTFKYRKVELKREGFDPTSVDEPLFVLADRERGYEVLNASLFERIKNGAVRL